MIKIKDVSLYYGLTPAILKFNFQFQNHKIYGLVGANGAGKTTLLKILAGVQEPTLGEVSINKKNWINHERQLYQEVSFVPDTFPVDNDLKTTDELKIHRLRFSEENDRFAKIRSDGWFTEFADKKGKELSRGMKQRLALAKAMINGPQWILLDEPASGLDPAGRLHLRSVLKSLKDSGCGVIISSHILADLQDICDEVLFFEKGQCVDHVRLRQQEESRFYILRSSTSIDRIRETLSSLATVSTQNEEILIHPIRQAGEVIFPEDILKSLLAANVKIGFWESEVNLEALYHSKHAKGELK